MGLPLSLAPMKSLVVRMLARTLPNPAKERRVSVALGPGISGWLRFSLVGFMSKTLSEVIGEPVQAVAYSRFGGFHRNRRFSDFQNPLSAGYQCWYGAYLVFDSENRRHFGLNDDGTPCVQDALDALEADQRLVFSNAGIELSFPDGRLVHPHGEFRQSQVREAGDAWWKLMGEAETWSTFHRGRLQGEKWRFRWCYGSVPHRFQVEVNDLHPLLYRGEFWIRYEPLWHASCCKFFIYPSYTDRTGTLVNKGTPELIWAGRAALAGIRFQKKRMR